MTDQVRPEDAARALDEVGRRQEQVIRTTAIPTWFWWTIAALMIVLAVALDTGRQIAIGIGAAVFTVGVVAATSWIAFGARRRAQVRNDLLGPAGVGAILGFVALDLAVALPTAYALRAAGNHHAATLGVAAGGLVLVTGGPLLTRLLQRIMLARRDGGRR
jgi:uncharacterized membrane protein YkvI